MLDTVTRWLQQVRDGVTREGLRQVIQPMADRYGSRSLTTGALRIDGGSASAVVELNATYYGMANGALVTKASGTNMAALSGTVANATFNVYCFFVDQAGNLTSDMGIAGATLAAVKFPPIPQGKAVIGFVIINPTGTGDFVGGTTELDDATVVPNAAFVNTVYGFDPSILL